MTELNGKTRIVAIIGNPINHTLSPIMQNAAFLAGGLNYAYIPFAVNPENLEKAVAGLKALGVCGFNVTIPHKTAIIPFLDGLDESAEAAGAVNTVNLSGTSFIGYNTDGDGLVDSLASDLEFFPGTEQIFVIGAGGAARGAIASLCRNGAKKITICNRSIKNAHSIMSDMKQRYPDSCITVISMNNVSEADIALSSLLLNTTSLGMKNEQIEGINLDYLPKNAKVYDMVYSISATPLIDEAAKLDLQSANGLGMLVAQGERAFEIWTGKKAPAGVMIRAVRSIVKL
jgi:shikimate dehydrogenase